MISEEGRRIAPTIYTDVYFDDYKRGMSLDEAVNEVVKLYRSSMPSGDMDMDFFFDFSKVTDKLFFKVVNLEKNKGKLLDVPYRKLLDLAMVPLCRVNNSVLGDGVITIQKSHLDNWEISEDELWENIGDNAKVAAPLKISGLVDVLERLSGQSLDMEPLCGISVVTNTADNLGAGAVFYPGVLEEMAAERECDLYIIPSSVHETLVIPDPQLEIDICHMRDIIREVNRTSVAEEEILSDNLYRYERESGRLFVVKD